MNIWKVMLHHESPDAAEEWSKRNGRIAVGWGHIGDLRTLGCRNPKQIADAIRSQYPALNNASHGGQSLWNFFTGMKPGDLVLLAGGGKRRQVVEVTGEYVWASTEDSIGDYRHQRKVVFTARNPDQLWQDVGGSAAAGQSVRWTVARCATVPAIGFDCAESQRYSEGTSYEIKASRIERNPEARRKCIEYHGCRCHACDFDFFRAYGEVGRGFIHVHHLSPLGDQMGEHEVDPCSDLIPLCPNCHAMAHRTNPPLTIADLVGRLRRFAAEPHIDRT